MQLQAHVAGSLSLQQYWLATTMDDPILQSRCRLYLALALSQVGRLRLATAIVRQQYDVARLLHSDLLRRCCTGVWSRLRSAHERRRKAKRAIESITGDCR